MKKKEVLLGANIKLPASFHLQLEEHLLKLKKMGIDKRKADLIAELAQIGFMRETTGN